jgi:hypothetical protein
MLGSMAVLPRETKTFVAVALGALLFSASPLVAQPVRKAVQLFKKEWKAIPPAPKGPQEWRNGLVAPSVQSARYWSSDRLDALKRLEPFHGPYVAKQLKGVCSLVEAELVKIDKQRAKLKKAIAAGYKAMRKSGRRLTTATPGYLKYATNSLEAGRLRAVRDGLEEQHAAMRNQVSALNPGGTNLLLGSSLGDKKLPFAFKLAVTRRASTLGDEMMAPLGVALNKARQPPEIAAVVEAIGTFGAKAKPLADKIIPLLGHADGGVRELSALALSQIAVPGAIEPMIKLLARESGLAKQRVAKALEVLTRQQFGLRVGAWQQWFAAEGAAYANGSKELGGGKPSSERVANKKSSAYYGIKQDGKAILYILDCSGSMAASIQNPRFEDPRTKTRPLPARSGEVSRMDACREKLSGALGKLTSDQRFNIIWYSFESHLYKKKMQQASPKNVKAAQRFLKTLQPDGATNIYDTMQLAFQATGRGTYDRSYSVDCDMMFLLTDGKPTLAGTSDGFDMVESILVGVRKWNALKRVVIHTIGIGEQLNTKFLGTLAKENGGAFRHHKGKNAAPVDGGKKDGVKESR